MERMAQFKKVSFEQFCDTWKKQYPTASYAEDTLEKRYGSIILPERSTSGAAGYDFRSLHTIVLLPGESFIFVTGIRCSMVDGWFLMIVPRSGLGFKYRAQLDNTAGIIDGDYYYAENEGHILIKITNDSKNNKTMVVNAGDKIAQGIFIPYGITTDDHAKGIRVGGFGSTGR